MAGAGATPGFAQYKFQAGQTWQRRFGILRWNDRWRTEAYIRNYLWTEVTPVVSVTPVPVQGVAIPVEWLGSLTQQLPIPAEWVAALQQRLPIPAEWTAQIVQIAIQGQQHVPLEWTIPAFQVMWIAAGAGAPWPPPWLLQFRLWDLEPERPLKIKKKPKRPETDREIVQAILLHSGKEWTPTRPINAAKVAIQTSLRQPPRRRIQQAWPGRQLEIPFKEIRVSERYAQLLAEDEQFVLGLEQ